MKPSSSSRFCCRNSKMGLISFTSSPLSTVKSKLKTEILSSSCQSNFLNKLLNFCDFDFDFCLFFLKVKVWEICGGCFFRAWLLFCLQRVASKTLCAGFKGFGVFCVPFWLFAAILWFVAGFFECWLGDAGCCKIVVCCQISILFAVFWFSICCWFEIISSWIFFSRFEIFSFCDFWFSLFFSFFVFCGFWILEISSSDFFDFGFGFFGFFAATTFSIFCFCLFVFSNNFSQFLSFDFFSKLFCSKIKKTFFYFFAFPKNFD